MNIYSFYNINMEYLVNNSLKSKDDTLEKFNFINFKFSKDGYDSKANNDKSVQQTYNEYHNNVKNLINYQKKILLLEIKLIKYKKNIDKYSSEEILSGIQKHKELKLEIDNLTQNIGNMYTYLKKKKLQMFNIITQNAIYKNNKWILID